MQQVFLEGRKIGFSNYSVGNSWRQQMEAEFESEVEKLKELATFLIM